MAELKRFGTNNKLQFDFLFINWRHHKNNVVLTAPSELKKTENCFRNCSSENQQTAATATAVTWTMTTTAAAAVWTTTTTTPATVLTTTRTTTTQTKKSEEGKNSESYEKRVSHPLEQMPEKIESFIPPSVTRTVLAALKKITPSAKSFTDAKFARKKAEKKARLQRQLHENAEKMNVIKNPKLT